ncbi:nitroreductase [Clostridium tetani]|uniref:Nitroreductase n=1 Tax=Clostridium tetani TaxID=1513 RepID=A0ABC8EDK2_CLOTA|nr:nitroreductase family protein [Clostridium tetani]BDR80930.1 nitroreductase [Clostridium tetani]BDR89387.1 nitroreductase [Clostridium tetani]
MKREFNFDIIDEIKNRWSPRAFSNEEIKKEDLLAMLEAARYAPSCFNEQPWKFILSYELDDLNLIRSVLVDSNRLWADKAPAFISILAKKRFDFDGRDNFWAKFDTGTAWGYLSLEGEKRGLVTHAMGGFKKELAKERLNIPEEYELIAVVAIGKLGNREELATDALKEQEEPGSRKALEEIYMEGKFK